VTNAARLSGETHGTPKRPGQRTGVGQVPATRVSGISGFGQTLVDDADGAAARGTLGLGSAATANTSDFAPAAHNHVAADITDFAEAVDDRVGALIVAGAGVTVTYNDGANTLTISAP
jgi:hypothetical protein